MKILVTGCAGFIGFHLSLTLLQRGETVYGIDSLNEYYDVNLKYARLSILKDYSNFSFFQIDISDREKLKGVFNSHDFTHVVNLAAQAGVRYSLTNPNSYIVSNLVGFGNILEFSKDKKIKNLVFASSSSVYGTNKKQPFNSADATEHPISLYAATKKSNEMLAHSYAQMFGLPCTGLRFFTVYGPWGRPDMALFKFTKNILENKPIDVYNHGNMSRDFTYIDDIVSGITATIYNPAKSNPDWNALTPEPSSSAVPYRIYNIGSNRPIELMNFIHIIEKILNKKAQINFMPIQAGDVESTFADINPLKNDFGYTVKTTVEEGVQNFITWYLKHYATNDTSLAV